MLLVEAKARTEARRAVLAGDIAAHRFSDVFAVPNIPLVVEPELCILISQGIDSRER